MGNNKIPVVGATRAIGQFITKVNTYLDSNPRPLKKNKNLSCEVQCGT
jgi:hypothetical protein